MSKLEIKKRVGMTTKHYMRGNNEWEVIAMKGFKYMRRNNEWQLIGMSHERSSKGNKE